MWFGFFPIWIVASALCPLNWAVTCSFPAFMAVKEPSLLAAIDEFWNVN